MIRTGRDNRKAPDGCPVFLSGQRVCADVLNAFVDGVNRERNGLVPRILSAPDGPLAELTLDATGCRRLRLSAFTAVVMGRRLDLETLPEAERSLPLPEVPVDEETVCLFLEIGNRRVVGIHRESGRLHEVSETSTALLMDPDVQYYEELEPILTGGSSASSKGGLEIARVRYDENGKPELIPEFVPVAETLGSVPATRRLIAAHLEPALGLSDRATCLLAERDELTPSLRWQLGALAAGGREIRCVLADHGRRLPDAYRIIATVLAETLRVLGPPQTGGRHVWPEEVWEEPHLLPDALLPVLDEFCNAADALVATTTEAPRERPGWIRLSAPALRVAGTPSATEFAGDLDQPLGQLVGSGCHRLLVEVRADAPLSATGPVCFHPYKSRDRILRRFGDISPRGLGDAPGFGFEVDLSGAPSPGPSESAHEGDGDSVGQRRRETEIRSEILASERIRFVCSVEYGDAPAGQSEISTEAIPGLSVRLRGVD